LWDESELGEASREKRERNMRDMMTRKGQDEKESGTRLGVEDGPRGDGLLMPLALTKDEHEHGHARQTSLALVRLEDEDGGERGTPPQLNDCHGYEYRMLLALVRPDDSHGPDLEHRTSSATGHQTSSAVAAPEDPHRMHEDDQQGIGMPLTLNYGPEHEPETSSPSKGELDHETSNSLAPKDEPELENSASPTLDTEPEPEPEPEQKPDPEPKPKTTPLASLARAFSFSEGR
jgi:hypothetical protein